MPYYLGEIRLNINRNSEKKEKKKTRLGTRLITIALITLLFLVPFTIFSVVIAAEPSLQSIFNDLGFTRIEGADIETFAAGKYNITLFAEFAGYRDSNELSFYKVETNAFNTIFSGPEGVKGPISGYVIPPVSKIFEVDYQFGLSILTPEHRYFTEHPRNADYPEKHVKIYTNLDNPEMLLIGFENKFGGFDRDYNDMVFSLVPILPLEIVNITRYPDVPNYDQPVTVIAQISNQTVNVDSVFLSYKIGSTNWINTSMSLENDSYIATIPPQTYGSLVTYNVHVSDLIGNSAVSKLYSYSIGDFVSPLISYVYNVSNLHIREVEFSANVDEPIGASGVRNVTLYYRTLRDWIAINMIKQDNLWRAIIPGQNEDVTIRFFIEAFDNVGNKANTSVSDYNFLYSNYSPIIVLMYSPIITYADEPVVFDGSGSYDPDGTIVSYLWDFGDGHMSSLPKVVHSFDENGEYPVSLMVVDNEGEISSKVAIQVIKNRIPIASLIKNSSIIGQIETISFDASGSYDPDGVIVSYFWDFGDGTNGTGPIINHSYSGSGTFTTTLTVTDNDGGVARIFTTKINQPPIAILTVSSSNVNIGEIVSFDASGSYDPDGVIVSYFWDFGDGTTSTGVSTQHAYPKSGKYNVLLTVKDNFGATDSNSSTEAIRNRPPFSFFNVLPEVISTGEIVSFDASGSYDPDGVIVSYFWDFGDGTTSTGKMTYHVYTDDDIYNVTLIVKDDEYAIGLSSLSKQVNNRVPIPSFTESATNIEQGQPISFDASGSYDPDGVIVSYFWDFGDQTFANDIIVNHEYDQPGNYTVTLTVEDDDGASSFTIAHKIITEESILSLAFLSLVGLGIAALTLTLLYGVLMRRKKIIKV